jgi:hypothetical protein
MNKKMFTFFYSFLNNLASVYELISTYGMEATPQAMEILFNEAMLIERTQHLGSRQAFKALSNFLAALDTICEETLVHTLIL